MPVSTGIFILEGEMTVILGAMKRGARWSSRDQQVNEHEPLIQKFIDLKEMLNDINLMETSIFLDPFLELIRSSNTTGPVTGLALSSVKKIIAYGLIDPKGNDTARAVENIAYAVNHARFLGTDAGSDEVVLLKILEVLRTLFLAPCAAHLTNESVCEILQSCFRICFEMRLTELLRKVAEQYLMDMVQLLFSRLPSMSEENAQVTKLFTKAEHDLEKKKRKALKAKGLADERGKLAKYPSIASSEGEEDVSACDNSAQHHSSLSDEEFPESGTLFTDHKVISLCMSNKSCQGSCILDTKIPYGVAAVKELFRFIISLINPQDKNNNDTMCLVGLSLLSVALEAGADNLAQFQPLLLLVKDDLCRSLLQLLSSDRLPVLAATLRVSLLLFESLRTHLKFQLEKYLQTLMEIITKESSKISHEQRELALESVVALWRIPGFVTELYLNYDCHLYCSNLFEDLVKMLSKNTFPVNGVYSTHLLSLDALLTVIDAIDCQCNSRIIRDLSGSYLELNCKNEGGDGTSLPKRHKISDNIPTHEELVSIKYKKQLLATGSEHFNMEPSKGITLLQEHSLLSDPIDPVQVATFIKENHRLDKKMIGEFLSRRKNLSILRAFAQSFDFCGLRIDEALRQYLEAFRLPGESPLISLFMEQFSDHWHKCNGEPFKTADAAFTLAYGIIMLNVDQHNLNVKKQNIPMTLEQFTKNLKGVNGGEDFDKQLLQLIYNAIKAEEVVMPAEQTGLVRENYLWKVLLKKGADVRGGQFHHAPSGSFDHDLFSLIWGPTVAALSYVLDKSDERILIEKALAGFRKCAMISAHYGMSDVFDNLAISLLKFTLLLNSSEGADQAILNLGSNYKAHMAAKTVFSLAHRHGDILREGWKNLMDCVYQFYKCGLLGVEMTTASDFVDPSGCTSLQLKEEAPPKMETGLFSSLYSYIAMSDSPREKLSIEQEKALREKAKECIRSCQPEKLISESKFLRSGSFQELVKTLIFASAGPDHVPVGATYDEDATVFFMEILIKIVLQNRDRANLVWDAVRDHLYSLTIYQQLVERSVVGILRLALCLFRRQNMVPQVLHSLRMLLFLKPACLRRVCRQISFALHELLLENAANIHDHQDWSTIFSLMECVGAGSLPSQTLEPAFVASDSEGIPDSGHISDASRRYTSDSELYSSVEECNTLPNRAQSLEHISQSSFSNATSGWILVDRMDIEAVLWDEQAFLRCVDSLTFLVRDLVHITPANFAATVHTCRVFVEVSMREGRSFRAGREMKKKKMKKSAKQVVNPPSPTCSYDADESESDEPSDGYNQPVLQLLDLMHALHTNVGKVFRAWEGEVGKDVCLWSMYWCPLLQGIARLCTGSSRTDRKMALTYLQKSLLVHDLQTLSAVEWESCFFKVLFPLLSKLLDPLNSKDSIGVEETRIRAAALLSKVFLHHLTTLRCLSTFSVLWSTILEFMRQYIQVEKGGDMLHEAVEETVKNMLLVMMTAGVLEANNTSLWNLTWEKINSFLPEMKGGLLKSHKEKGSALELNQMEN